MNEERVDKYLDGQDTNGEWIDFELGAPAEGEEVEITWQSADGRWIHRIAYMVTEDNYFEGNLLGYEEIWVLAGTEETIDEYPIFWRRTTDPDIIEIDDIEDGELPF